MAWAVDSSEVTSGNVAARQSLRSLRENDRVLFFQRNGNDITFSSVGKIAAVKASEGEQIVEFGETENISPSRSLQVLAYSLRKVTRFDHPARHFRNRINKLNEDDFDTILNGEVYLSRSAFGYFINQLPAERFLEFVRWISIDSSELLIENPDFKALWSRLRSWIESEYIEPFSYIDAIEDLAQQLRGTGVEFERIRIGIRGKNLNASIASLHTNLNTLYVSLGKPMMNSNHALEPQSDLLSRIDLRMSDSSYSELRFENIFRNQPWPITQRIQL